MFTASPCRCLLLPVWMNESSPAERQVKCVLVGPSGAGKTTLFHRLLLDNTPTYSLPTISPLVSSFSFRGAKVLLWDTAGQEQYNAVTKACLRNTDVCLAVFSLPDPESLSVLREWIGAVVDTSPRCRVIAVGNKCDNGCNCMAQDVLACDTDAYVEISAKTGANTSTLLHELGVIIDELLLSSPDFLCGVSPRLSLSSSPPRKECC